MDRAPHLPLNPSRIEVIAGLTDDCQAMIRRSPGITGGSPGDHLTTTARSPGEQMRGRLASTTMRGTPTLRGEVVARAKRTDRAEARRRHRAQIASQSIDSSAEPEDDEPQSTQPATARNEAPAGRRGSAPRGQPPERLGFMAALRGAYEPAHVREDLAALPELLRSRAIVVPALLVLASTVVFIAAINAGNLDATGGTLNPSASVATSAAPSAASAAASSSAGPAPSGAASTGGGRANEPLGIVASLLSLLFLQVPPIGAIYAAAVLAKRSSYLAGGIAGLLGAVGLTAVLYSVPVDAAITDVRAAYAAQAIVTSTIFGVLLGGALGYYRRLLRLMNPNRSRPAPARGRATGRRR